MLLLAYQLGLAVACNLRFLLHWVLSSVQISSVIFHSVSPSLLLSSSRTFFFSLQLTAFMPTSTGGRFCRLILMLSYQLRKSGSRFFSSTGIAPTFHFWFPASEFSGTIATFALSSLLWVFFKLTYLQIYASEPRQGTCNFLITGWMKGCWQRKCLTSVTPADSISSPCVQLSD